MRVLVTYHVLEIVSSSRCPACGAEAGEKRRIVCAYDNREDADGHLQAAADEHKDRAYAILAYASYLGLYAPGGPAGGVGVKLSEVLPDWDEFHRVADYAAVTHVAFLRQRDEGEGDAKAPDAAPLVAEGAD